MSVLPTPEQEMAWLKDQLEMAQEALAEYKAKWDGKEGVIAIERYNRRGHFMDRLHADKDRLEAELAEVRRTHVKLEGIDLEAIRQGWDAYTHDEHGMAALAWAKLAKRYIDAHDGEGEA